jgi:hypothetical protein
VPNLYVRNEVVTDSMGNPLSGVQIALASQPATTNIFPPTPAVQLYGDSAGADPLSTPPQTDAYGMASYYAPPGLFTVCYYSPQIAGQTYVLTDQSILASYNGLTFNSDTSTNGTILPNPDGSTVQFALSAAPNPPTSLVLMLNGIVQSAYAFSGATVVFQTAPHVGDVITARYQVQD